ncbi:MAG: helix-turn-helix domain-containing protein [Cryomorphaceae bacterium]
MTEKQQNILNAALKLFAQEGYASTSTSKVAQEAGVSEGLIFRHFKSKEGLLHAVLQKSKEAAHQVFSNIVMTNDPNELLRKTLEMPFSIPSSDYEMWRLTYALKWQTDGYDIDSMEYVKVALRNAFNKLGYDDPDAETEVIFMFLDGAASALLLHPPGNLETIVNALKSKYQL